MAQPADVAVALRRARLAASLARPRPKAAPCSRSTGALRIESYFEAARARQTGMVPLPIEFAPPPEMEVDAASPPAVDLVDIESACAVVELGAPPRAPNRWRRVALATLFTFGSVGVGVALGALT